MSGLVTEADALRTIVDGTYTIPELYDYVAERADITRDGGLEPPDEQHPTDTRWRRRVRGLLQTLRASGNANRISASVWAIRGTRGAPQHLVLLGRGGKLRHVELIVRDAAALLGSLEQPADLVLCDPPYGLQRGTARSVAAETYARNNRQVVPGYVDVPPEEYSEFTERWVTAAAGALRPGGMLAVITGPQRAAIVQCAAEQAGLSWVNSVAAFREFALRTTRRFACSHWTVTIMCAGPPDHRRRVFNTPPDLPKARSGADYPLDWWPSNGRSDRPGLLRYDNSLAPLLARRTIRSCSRLGELVVDPCVGSGTTAIEALRLGRRFIGADVNPHAIRFAAARLLAEYTWPQEGRLATTTKGGAALASVEDPDPWDMLAEFDSKKQNVIECALSHMTSRGWLDDEPGAELLGDLARLYDETPEVQKDIVYNGDVLHDLAASRPWEHLALLVEDEYREQWEREEAERWSCPCGHPFGVYSWSSTLCHYYTLAEDGTFDEHVEKCPTCSRTLAKVRAELAEGQLGFAF